MKWAFCTYFDSNYLARGVAMLQSLRRHEPLADIHVLAFDELCAEVLEAMFGTTIRVIRAGTLHERDSSLAATRATRSQWEFYATHKPVLGCYLLGERGAPDGLIYVDADLWFFDDFSSLIAELDESSIGLSPHRFHDGTRKLAIYGTYNAGFLCWRNDAIARRALEDWRAECLEWCSEKAEPDGRFMNQGYLNRWPERYSGVHIIANPGVNLAPWNVDGHRVERQGSRITVDGEPLVFYHYSGIARDEEGWYTYYQHRKEGFDVVRDAIIAPYLEVLEDVERMLIEKFSVAGTGSVRPKPNRTGAVTILRAGPAKLVDAQRP